MNGFNNSNGGFNMNGNVTIPAEIFAQLVRLQQNTQQENRRLKKTARKLGYQVRQLRDANINRQFAASGNYVDPQQFSAPTYDRTLCPVPVQNDPGCLVPAQPGCGIGGMMTAHGGSRLNPAQGLALVAAGGILGALAVGFICAMKER